MKIVRVIICLGLLFTPGALAAGDRAGKNGETGLPIPRFVSLRAAEVNMRAGPGREYKIMWVYLRRGLPMEVVREFGHWRQVREFSGESGWIRSNMLSGIANVQVIAEIGTMHAEPATGSRLVARMERGVIAKLHDCEGEWCRIEAKDYEGWVNRAQVWGDELEGD
ncbi:MAG: SH3 domain-containing protein [Alphaproteobacteria bacterium]|nr:SH3 domain-containing protein [Alphaproteobacteria bacterium]